jgi:group I intron endonuclease
MIVNIGIYRIYSKLNGKNYIGESLNISKRKWRHFSELSGGYHTNKYLQRHVNKYGVEDLGFEIIEFLPKDSKLLFEREVFWIKFYKSNDYKLGFNLNEGGLGGASTTIKHKNFSLVRITDGMTFQFDKISDFEEMNPNLNRHKINDVLNGIRKVSKGWTTIENYNLLKDKQDKRAAEVDAKKHRIKPKPPLFIKTFLVRNIRTNQIISSKNVRLFCAENNLTYNSLLRVIRGERKRHKDWVLP